jgi:branched-chain amino acid transport system substrate-binding protein
MMPTPTSRTAPMRSWLNRTATVLALLTAGGFSSPGRAAELVVAQVAPLTGPFAYYSEQFALGIRAYFDRINAGGGIRGDTLRLASRDDEATPAKALALIKKVNNELKPVAFMYLIGPDTITATNEADTFAQMGVPLLGSSPPAFKLRTPVRSHVFHIGQGEDAEYAKLAQQIRTVGLRSVAVIHWDDPATMGELEQFTHFAATAPALNIVETVPVKAFTDELEPEPLKKLMAVKADAIVTMLPVEQAATMLKALHKNGIKIPVYGPSYNESGHLFDMAGEEASRGMTVTQVVPNPFGGRTQVSREYQKDMEKFAPKGTRASTLSMEGYIAARLLVEAIKGTAQPVTAAGVRNALEQRSPFDLGGIKAILSPTDHVALDYVDISIITRGGRLIQ